MNCWKEPTYQSQGCCQILEHNLSNVLLILKELEKHVYILLLISFFDKNLNIIDIQKQVILLLSR